jgi:site-specific recombinase XerD
MLWKHCFQFIILYILVWNSYYYYVSVVASLTWGGRGRRFKSCQSDQFFNKYSEPETNANGKRERKPERDKMESYPLAEAAKLLGCTEQSLKGKVSRGEIQAVKIPKGKRLIWALTKAVLIEQLASPKKEKLTYETLIKEWEHDQSSGYLNGHQMREGTLERKRWDLKAFWSDLGQPPSVEAITVDNIRRALANAAKGMPSRRVNMYKTMMTLYRYLVHKGLRPESDMPLFLKFKPPENKNPNRTFITEKEYCKLREVNQAWIYGRSSYDIHLLDTFMVIAWNTGMRNSEICNLLLEDINFSERIISVVSRDGAETKTGEERELGMSNELFEHLKDFVTNCRPPYPRRHLLVQRTGIPMHYRLFTERVRDLSKKAKIKIKPHGFRHSLATNLLLNGAPTILVQKITGHKRLETLQIYDRSTDRDAVNLLRNKTAEPQIEPEKPATKKRWKKVLV